MRGRGEGSGQVCGRKDGGDGGGGGADSQR